MARERMVTRTVKVAVCEVMCLDTITATVSHMDYTVPGGVTAEKELLKYIQKSHDTATFKCVAITKVEHSDILYGMPEEVFIKLATVLPSRGGKAEEG